MPSAITQTEPDICQRSDGTNSDCAGLHVRLTSPDQCAIFNVYNFYSPVTDAVANAVFGSNGNGSSRARNCKRNEKGEAKERTLREDLDRRHRVVGCGVSHKAAREVSANVQNSWDAVFHPAHSVDYIPQPRQQRSAQTEGPLEFSEKAAMSSRRTEGVTPDANGHVQHQRRGSNTSENLRHPMTDPTPSMRASERLSLSNPSNAQEDHQKKGENDQPKNMSTSIRPQSYNVRFPMCREWFRNGDDRPISYSAGSPKLVEVYDEGRKVPALLLSRVLASKVQNAIECGQDYREYREIIAKKKHEQIAERRLNAEITLESIEHRLEWLEQQMKEASDGTTEELTQRHIGLLKERVGARRVRDAVEGDQKQLFRDLQKAEETYRKDWAVVDEELENVWIRAGILQKHPASYETHLQSKRSQQDEHYNQGGTGGLAEKDHPQTNATNAREVTKQPDAASLRAPNRTQRSAEHANDSEMPGPPFEPRLRGSDDGEINELLLRLADQAESVRQSRLELLDFANDYNYQCNKYIESPVHARRRDTTNQRRDTFASYFIKICKDRNDRLQEAKAAYWDIQRRAAEVGVSREYLDHIGQDIDSIVSFSEEEVDARYIVGRSVERVQDWRQGWEDGGTGSELPPTPPTQTPSEIGNLEQLDANIVPDDSGTSCNDWMEGGDTPRRNPFYHVPADAGAGENKEGHHEELNEAHLEARGGGGKNPVPHDQHVSERATAAAEKEGESPGRPCRGSCSRPASDSRNEYGRISALDDGSGEGYAASMARHQQVTGDANPSAVQHQNPIANVEVDPEEPTKQGDLEEGTREKQDNKEQHWSRNTLGDEMLNDTLDDHAPSVSLKGSTHQEGLVVAVEPIDACNAQAGEDDGGCSSAPNDDLELHRTSRKRKRYTEDNESLPEWKRQRLQSESSRPTERAQETTSASPEELPSIGRSGTEEEETASMDLSLPTESPDPLHVCRKRKRHIAEDDEDPRERKKEKLDEISPCPTQAPQEAASVSSDDWIPPPDVLK